MEGLAVVAFGAASVAAEFVVAVDSAAVEDSTVGFVVEDSAADSAVSVAGSAVGFVGDSVEEVFEVDWAAEDSVAASAVSEVDSAVASAEGSVAEAPGALTGSTAPSSAIDSAASDSTSMTLMTLLLRRGSFGPDRTASDIPIRTIGVIPTVLTPAVHTATILMWMTPSTRQIPRRRRCMPRPSIRLQHTAST